MIVRRALKNDAVVAGGGAIEMELSKYLRDYSRTIAGKQQILIGAFAKALEIVPRQLCDNAGFDATNILNKLRQKHAQGEYMMRELGRGTSVAGTGYQVHLNQVLTSNKLKVDLQTPTLISQDVFQRQSFYF